jgi:hypothetical protein
MIQDFPGRAELLELLGLLRDGEAVAEHIARIEQIVRGDERAMSIYVQYVHLCIALHYRVGKASGASAASAALPICPLLHTFPSAVGSSCAGPLPDSSSAGVPPPRAPRSGVLRFLGDLAGQGRRLAADHIVFSALAVLVFVAVATLIAMGAWNWKGGRLKAEGGSEIAHQKSEIPTPQSEISRPSVPPAPSARLVRVKDCCWNGQAPAPQIGQTVPIGQPLNLASGVAEIDFDIGVKVILQAPAAFQLLSPNSARLQRGKATVEIKNERARGFKILTPEATFVDQGTEFGVEVAPGGSSKVHVFKGLVDVDQKARDGRDAPLTQRLAENVGALMEPGEEGMTLVQDTGECFIRSMDEADRDRHTIAYWRFEDRPVGAALPHTGRNKNPVRATSDSTFNGNDLFVASPDSRPVFSGDVSAATVPQSGATNHSCLDLTDPMRSNKTPPDVYTNSLFSHAAPRDLQEIAPERWTVEASAKIKQQQNTCQTIVCRDAIPGEPACFFLLVNQDAGFAVSFIDASHRQYTVSTHHTVEPNRWYHLAVTSDGRTLRLHVDACDGQGYKVLGSKILPRTGSTALGMGHPGCACSWAVGRAPWDTRYASNRPDDHRRLHKATVCDPLIGWIDEVRICDVALDPSEFLFAPPARSSRGPLPTESKEAAADQGTGTAIRR